MCRKAPPACYIFQYDIAQCLRCYTTSYHIILLYIISDYHYDILYRQPDEAEATWCARTASGSATSHRATRTSACRGTRRWSARRLLAVLSVVVVVVVAVVVVVVFALLESGPTPPCRRSPGLKVTFCALPFCGSPFQGR